MTITVVLPIYNAFEDARACLNSVLCHTPLETAIVVIDDASPIGDFRSAIGPAISERIALHRNETNLGFAATCNRAFLEIVPTGDVILLNSDTIVTERWLEKITRAAYSRSNIGTVSTLTNNGTICAVPRFLHDNSLPEGFTVDEFATLVEVASRCTYPEIPTSVGHCLFIRREALNASGGFDAETFGRGYGEENDLSCRLQKLGFVDVLDDATFVYHKGQSSFGAEASSLKKINAEKLNQKHPEYLRKVHEFVAENPLHTLHTRIWNGITSRWSKHSVGQVLHILHNGPTTPVNHALGGTELHVGDLIAAIPEIAHWSLTPKIDRYLLTAHIPGAERTIEIARSTTKLAELLRADFFDVIHVHHLLGYDRKEIVEAIIAHGRYFVSIHDYHLLCQQSMMLTPAGNPCTRHECVTTCGYSSDTTYLERALAAKLISKADETIVFSESSVSVVDHVLHDAPLVRIKPHGIKFPDTVVSRVFRAAVDSTRPGSGGPLRLVVLGSVSTHKGSPILQKLSEIREIRGARVELHVLGSVVEGQVDAIVHGPYTRDQIASKLAAINPHIGMVLSLAPETYCLTLDELFSAGLPVFVTRGGAPEERVAKYGAGWVLSGTEPDDLASEIVALLDEILGDWTRYSAARRAAARVPLLSFAEEAVPYREMYKLSMGTAPEGTKLLLNYFQPGLVPSVDWN